MIGLIIGLLFLLVVCIIASISTYLLEQENKRLEVKVAELTADNIELEKNLEECKQTVKVLQKLNKVSDKTLDLHTKHMVCWGDLTEDEKSDTMLDIVSSRPLPSACKVCFNKYCFQRPQCEHYKERFHLKLGYPSKAVDEHFDELV